MTTGTLPSRYTLFVYWPSGTLAWQEEIVGEVAMTETVNGVVDEGYAVDVVPHYFHAASGRYMTVPGTEWRAEP